jgi:uncharacterized protein (TIGR02246 family)
MICPAAGQTAQMAHDAENVQALLDGMSRAWNIHDARVYSLAFSEDADFTNTLGITSWGRDSIQKVHEKSFATVFKYSSLKITDKRIKYITEDILSVDVYWEMKGVKAPDGKDIPLSKGFANLLLTRDDKLWGILTMHIMNLPGS